MRRQLISRRLRGESLLEVMIAVVILSTVLVSIFSLIVRTSSLNVNVSNRVVALNIAREGMEAVRNIRDTNWLQYSGDRRAKWLCYDQMGMFMVPACLNTVGATLTEMVYTVEYSEARKRYFLEKVGGAANLIAADTLPDSRFRLSLDSIGRFVHDAAGEDTPFYRQIYLSPESDYINSSCIIDGCPRSERLRVATRVQWKEGKKVHHLDLETYLYDFFARESY